MLFKEMGANKLNDEQIVDIDNGTKWSIADNLYLGKSAKAVSAGTAVAATKTTQENEIARSLLLPSMRGEK